MEIILSRKRLFPTPPPKTIYYNTFSSAVYISDLHHHVNKRHNFEITQFYATEWLYKRKHLSKLSFEIYIGNPDTLICGNCRECFLELGELLDHKRSYCKLRFTCKCQENFVNSSK